MSTTNGLRAQERRVPSKITTSGNPSRRRKRRDRERRTDTNRREIEHLHKEDRRLKDDCLTENCRDFCHQTFDRVTATGGSFVPRKNLPVVDTAVAVERQVLAGKRDMVESKLSPIVSPTGYMWLVVGLGQVGYKDSNNVVMTDGFAFGNAVPTQVETGIFAPTGGIGPKLARSLPTDENDVSCVMTSFFLEATVNFAAVDDRGGAMVVAWMPDTIRDNGVTGFTYQDVLALPGATEYSTAFLTKSGKFSYVMPPSKMCVSNLTDDWVNSFKGNTQGGAGYLVVGARGMLAADTITFVVNSSYHYFGSDVDPDILVIADANAADCVEECMVLVTQGHDSWGNSSVSTLKSHVVRTAGWLMSRFFPQVGEAMGDLTTLMSYVSKIRQHYHIGQ